MSQLWDLREITTSTSPRTNESFIFARENKTSSSVAETIDGAASPNLDTYHPPPFTDCKTFFHGNPSVRSMKSETFLTSRWNRQNEALKQCLSSQWLFLLMQAKTLCFIVLAGINKPVNCSSFGLGFFFFLMLLSLELCFSPGQNISQGIFWAFNGNYSTH